jgi:hypothetical protein
MANGFALAVLGMEIKGTGPGKIEEAKHPR